MTPRSFPPLMTDPRYVRYMSIGLHLQLPTGCDTYSAYSAGPRVARPAMVSAQPTANWVTTYSKLFGKPSKAIRMELELCIRHGGGYTFSPHVFEALPRLFLVDARCLWPADRLSNALHRVDAWVRSTRETADFQMV